jgi:hypothetical protein
MLTLDGYVVQAEDEGNGHRGWDQYALLESLPAEFV